MKISPPQSSPASPGASPLSSPSRQPRRQKKINPARSFFSVGRWWQQAEVPSDGPTSTAREGGDGTATTLKRGASIFYWNGPASRSSQSFVLDVKGGTKRAGGETSSGSPPLPARAHDIADEAQPLLHQQQRGTFEEENRGGDDPFSSARRRRFVHIAAAFLRDYQSSRGPTLSTNLDGVTDFYLMMHAVQSSRTWGVVMAGATAVLFLGSCFEGGDGDSSWHTYDNGLLRERGRRKGQILTFCALFPMAIYFADLLLMWIVGGGGAPDSPTAASSREFSAAEEEVGGRRGERQAEGNRRSRRTRESLTAIFFLAFAVETLITVGTDRVLDRRLWTSVFKPVVVFCASTRSRNALDAINRVARIVAKVLMVELFLIFIFGAIACQVYGDFDSFSGLGVSFLSMFELSTTVVNPSLWSPVMNERGEAASLFFIPFLIVSVFYTHSLVLSVVFQSYMDGMSFIRERTAFDRERALELAFEAVFLADGVTKAEPRSLHELEPVAVSTASIKEVLGFIRPHYGRVKLDALVNIVDPHGSGSVDYDTFRRQVPKALNTSVRSKKPYNRLSQYLEAFAMFVALANVAYILVASSKFHNSGWDAAVTPIAFVITILGIAELAGRLAVVKIFRISDVTAAQPDIFFDGIAVSAAAISVVGLVMIGLNRNRALDYVFTGRAIDMTRCLRLNKEARDIVKRSTEVLPALLGPVVLIITAMHIFNSVGMTIWRGRVIVGSNPDLVPYYDLNNFNSYTSGMITLFQVLVVNDWHAIADVFILPGSSVNALVHPFFILANLVLTSVLLNVMIAFFVSAFVTKASQMDILIGSEVSERSILPLSRTGSLVSLTSRVYDDAGVNSEREVTVRLRQDFDRILRTVAGGMEEEDDLIAKLSSHTIELFESLSLPHDEDKVGYIVSCRRSKQRYGNQRMINMVRRFMDNRKMHQIITEMHRELSVIADAENAVVRRFQLTDEESQELEIRASLLQMEDESSVGLFVAKLVARGQGE